MSEFTIFNDFIDIISGLVNILFVGKFRVFFICIFIGLGGWIVSYIVRWFNA